jgi:light-regulated signal transduction histidine kinase (bacteriophytochrome)
MDSIELLRLKLATLSVSEVERKELESLMKNVEKEHNKVDFKRHRLDKDRSIAINLLNASVEDLQRQKDLVVEKNGQLLEQKREIELKNVLLEQQKQLLKEKSNRLHANLKALELSYSELEQFSFVASHDLKTPLRNIASFAQLLQRKYLNQLDEEANEYIEFIVGGVTKMNAILGDLLEYSKIGNKQDVMRLTNLNLVVQEVKQNLVQEIKESKATIIADELPELMTYPKGMIQLFQQLIHNSIKFRKNNEVPVIEIRAQWQKKHWLFTIADNGLGFEAAYQHKAFEPFQRIDHLDLPGTGMGLAICKKVVKMHHGDIWCQSAEGIGSVFNFTIVQNGLEQHEQLTNLNTVATFSQQTVAI